MSGARFPTRVVRTLRLIVIAIAWTALTVTVLAALAWGVGRATGHRSLTVLSGSMEPMIATGDIVVTKRISPDQARIGQVVSFRDPTGEQRLIIHRVRRIRDEGSTWRFTTRGDANNTFERWSVPANGTIGRVWLRIPKLGYLLAQTRTPAARIALVVIPALLVGLMELTRLWRPRRRPTTAPAPRASGSGAFGAGDPDSMPGPHPFFAPRLNYVEADYFAPLPLEPAPAAPAAMSAAPALASVPVWAPRLPVLAAAAPAPEPFVAEPFVPEPFVAEPFASDRFSADRFTVDPFALAFGPAPVEAPAPIHRDETRSPDRRVAATPARSGPGREVVLAGLGVAAFLVLGARRGGRARTRSRV